MDAFASAAAQAFEETERVRLLLDKKEKALSQAVRAMAVKSDDQSRLEYFDYTAGVLAKYEEKRATAGL